MLIGATLLTLASCGKTPEPVATQSGTTNSGVAESLYTADEIDAMVARVANKPFSVNS
jgi:hypothetical protein